MCDFCLCADRFGLGWAHDAICFACHMFIHFPCIRTFFSIFDIIDVAWDFSDCSFLFLPLFLFTLVVSMTPKRKSTPAWNPFRSGASSSSDPSPSNVRFHDDDVFTEFSENFSRWGIHLEWQVILSNFAGTNLPFVIHSRGWESLCDVSVTCLSCWSRSFTPTCMGLIV